MDRNNITINLYRNDYTYIPNIFEDSLHIRNNSINDYHHMILLGHINLSSHINLIGHSVLSNHMPRNVLPNNDIQNNY